MNQEFIENLGAARQKFLDGQDANQDDINLDIFEDFYPDQAHFIFELLQNAEDAKATEVLFCLSREGCLIEHNGNNFTEVNVKKITGIHKSTKINEEDKIGKFGIGFKSVFVYTCTPTIWSGSFSFKILRYVKPVYIDPDLNIGMKTRFWLPFDNPAKKNIKTAYDEINLGLNDLSETTLLFLTNIKVIRWSNADGDCGDIKRIQHNEKILEIHKQINGKTTLSAHFLKFDEPVIGSGNQHKISIAYHLDFISQVKELDAKKPIAKQLKIVPASTGQVAIYFPAKKEHSGLRFNLHAPFVPELSRASIKETEVNTPLFKQLARLAATSLHQIRNLGLLTPDFLSVLPNSQDLLGENYELIRKSIFEEMNEKPLTPTFEKTYAPAKFLFQAKPSLKNLLSKDDLLFIAGEDNSTFIPQWAANRTMQGSRVERFMSGLAIADWEERDFVNWLDEMSSIWPYSNHIADGQHEEFINWLAKKSTAWHQEFYALLFDYTNTLTIREKSTLINRLKRMKIICLNNGSYSIGDESFFPEEGSENDEVFPRVNIEVYTSGKKKKQKDSAKAFLKELDVREVGEVEQIESILNQRYLKENLAPSKNDLKRFIDFFEKNDNKAHLFSEYYIFENCQNKWCRPCEIYIDLPFKETGLYAFFSAMGGEARHYLLSDNYTNSDVKLKRLLKFAEAVGVHFEIPIRMTNCKKNPDAKLLYSIGGKVTSNSIDRDFVIDGLTDVLSVPSLTISKTIWHRMIALPWYPNHLMATYQNNASSGSKTSYSGFVHQLRASKWIPQAENIFVRPAEASEKLLPIGFKFDPSWSWLKSIGFGDEFGEKSEVSRQMKFAAKTLGFGSVDKLEKWAELDKLGINPDEILSTFKIPDFLDRESSNSERRAGKIADEVNAAAKIKRVIKNRSVDSDYGEAQNEARKYLTDLYTDDNGVMFCQICMAPQPVKLDGVPYFEAVTCVCSVESHHKPNNLALCPNHAAMYKKSGLDAAIIQASIIECEKGRFSLNLAGNIVHLVFSKKHLNDLQVVLKTSIKDSK
jgi:hypothetical protein